MRSGSWRPSPSVASRPLLLGTISIFLSFASSQSPPQLLPEALEPRERVVPEGTNVQFSCPVEADPDTLFFEWYRDREPLNLFADDRYRVQGNGVLRIKNAIPEDTGLYLCRAVNGFGSTDVNVTLIVLGSPESVVRASDDYEDEDELGRRVLKPDTDDNDMEKTHAGAEAGKPRLTQVSNFHGTVAHKYVGSSITLRCAARANPKPQISWLKNGKPLPDSNLPSNSRRGHWNLFLKNLQASDTGNYTCHVYNGLGSVSATFMVKVTDRIRTKPDFVSNYPHNLTVLIGDSAVFQCLLVSDVTPNVQWLKQIPEATAHIDDSHTVVHVFGEYFEVLKSTEVIEYSNGTFLNKLVVPTVREKDGGKYSCLEANAMGYSSRNAFLNVITEPQFHELNRSNLILPFPILVGIVVSGAIILAGLLGLILYCRSRQRLLSVPSSRVTTATNTITTTSSSTSSGAGGGRLKDQHILEHSSNHMYVGMTYHPHLDDSPARIYIPTSQLHKTAPLNSIFL